MQKIPPKMVNPRDIAGNSEEEEGEEEEETNCWTGWLTTQKAANRIAMESQGSQKLMIPVTVTG